MYSKYNQSDLDYLALRRKIDEYARGAINCMLFNADLSINAAIGVFAGPIEDELFDKVVSRIRLMIAGQ